VLSMENQHGIEASILQLMKRSSSPGEELWYCLLTGRLFTGVFCVCSVILWKPASDLPLGSVVREAMVPNREERVGDDNGALDEHMFYFLT